MEPTLLRRFLNHMKRMTSGLVPKKHYRVLVIEDDTTLEPVINRAASISDKNVTVHWVASVSQAEIYIEKNRYDLILSDILLSGDLSGLDFWEKCQRVGLTTPFIIMSSISEKQFFQSISEDQHPKFLQKPFKFRDCCKTLNQYL